MIKKLNVNRFGCFVDFDWDASLVLNGEVQNFGALNLIYGRNYSGKTTLSRIFQSVERKEVPASFDDPNFELVFNDGSALTVDDIAETTVQVQVFNRHFVEKNLSFLGNESEGSIRPFALIGSDNQEIQDQVTALETKCYGGSSDGGTKQVLEKKYLDAQTYLDRKQAMESELSSKLSSAARDIKNRPELGRPTYNRTQLVNDIESISEHDVVRATEIDGLTKILLATESGQLQKLVVELPSPQLVTPESLKKILSPVEDSTPIEALLADPKLETWVGEGLAIHAPDHDSCKFCTNEISPERWKLLESHFGKKVEEKIALATHAIAELQELGRLVIGLKMPDKISFYGNLHGKYDEIAERLAETKTRFTDQIAGLVESLNLRKKNAYAPAEDFELPDLSAITVAVRGVNDLIEKNNEIDRDLAAQKKDASDHIIRFEAKRIATAIAYDDTKTNIDLLDQEIKKADAEFSLASDEFEADLEKLAELKASLTDERAAAESINQLLMNSMGELRLRLDVEEFTEFDDDGVENDQSTVNKFAIYRNNIPANNLSEGEKNLIAFAYFVVSLERAEIHKNKCIIYIDDPISSLDSNHIYAIYAIIDKYILNYNNKEKKYNFMQYIIYTHNLEFFKYIKRLNAGDNDKKYFSIKNSGGNSKIIRMPKYIKEFGTEFNYLFKEIYNIAYTEVEDLEDGAIFNFGNNLRKFLEIYLYFRFPDFSDSQRNYSKFYGETGIAHLQASRYANEYSHIEEFIDRGLTAQDPAEAAQIAKLTLHRIHNYDSDQCEAFCRSVGVDFSKIAADV